jgi:hypothetical protein
MLWLLPCSWPNTSHGSSPAGGLTPDPVLACESDIWLLSALMPDPPVATAAAAAAAAGPKTAVWMSRRSALALLPALCNPSAAGPGLAPSAAVAAGTGVRACLAALPAGLSNEVGDWRPEEPPAKLSLLSKSLPRAARSRMSSRCCTLQSQQGRNNSQHTCRFVFDAGVGSVTHMQGAVGDCK